MLVYSQTLFIRLLSDTVASLFCRAGSDEAAKMLKKLGANEVFTESQLDVKNFKGLLVLSLDSVIYLKMN